LAAWALASQPLLPRSARDWSAAFPRSEMDGLFEGYDIAGRTSKPATIVIGWYLGSPWSDSELAQRTSALLNKRLKHDPMSQTLFEILRQAGKKPEQDAT